LLQKMSKTGVSSMGVVEKRTVTINVSLGALVKNMSNAAGVELRRELGTVRVLNAMHRPEDLFDSVENDAVARLFSLVVCGEAAVVGWMPIFGRDDEIEASLQFICKRDDLITMRHCQRAARQKIILEIDEDQRVHRNVLRIVILSEAKNLGSILNRCPTGNRSEMFRFAQHDSAMYGMSLVHFNC